jgi:hypothetical protein
MPTKDTNFFLDMPALEFKELEDRYGHENACAILRTLEQIEGVQEADVAQFTWQDRLKNVFELMKDGLRFQTRH